MPRVAGGCSFGREAPDLCPHGIEARPYLTSTICWRDRVIKELDRLAPPEAAAPAAPLKAVSSAELAAALPREYFPIGGRNKLNNCSSNIKEAIGPSSWNASGGLGSTYRTQTGHVPQGALALDLLEQAQAEGAWGAAAHQLAAVRQRSEGTILRHGGFPGNPGGASAHRRPATEPRERGAADVQKGSLWTAARAEGRRGAAAHQVSAMRRRSEGSLVRLGRLQGEQLDAARAQGQHTMVGLAEAMHPALRQQRKRESAAQCGRDTMTFVSW
eukprot:TRINITY_DN28742_c0_g1_i1.p1 TRINITY_DN28742_c0_g1~~TRINITY_DN28742_c0_g1_i1.p1  ORF type:complete len:284 (+),score=43.43 TRINITY_DN28742_c0_g1_i1:38-853(+)